MAILREYHKPATVAEADRLLRTKGYRAALISGGTGIVAELELGLRPEVDTLIDLGHLGLCYVRSNREVIHIGAGATLSELLENSDAATIADGLLRRAARGEGPINYRNSATVGGVVATAPHDSELFAALLALEATVLVTDHDQPVPLAHLVMEHRIVLELRVAVRPARGGHARVARTPADRPIVAALAVSDGEGTRVALCGVADHPVLEGQEYTPFADFIGSAEYRQSMARVVAARARSEIRQGK